MLESQHLDNPNTPTCKSTKPQNFQNLSKCQSPNQSTLPLLVVPGSLPIDVTFLISRFAAMARATIQQTSHKTVKVKKKPKSSKSLNPPPRSKNPPHWASPTQPYLQTVTGPCIFRSTCQEISNINYFPKMDAISGQDLNGVFKGANLAVAALSVCDSDPDEKAILTPGSFGIIPAFLRRVCITG